MGKPDDQSPFSAEHLEQLSVSLAATAYRRGEVRVATSHFAGRTHLVASRQGLFAADRDGCDLIAHGLFFGLTRRNEHIFAFESGDQPFSPTNRGRIVRFTVVDRCIDRAEILADGLANGCHQIDFIGDTLCVMDTYNQTILGFTADGGEVPIPQPLPPVQRPQWEMGYVHINSIIGLRDHILVMLHNGMRHTGRQSRILVLDRQWQPLGYWSVPGAGCHDFACAPDGGLLTCGSFDGELLTLDGRRAALSDLMTRGLSVTADGIVVGASRYSTRRWRLSAPGRLLFLDPDWNPVAQLDLPGAPTAICAIEGPDYRLGDWARLSSPRLPPLEPLAGQ